MSFTDEAGKSNEEIDITTIWKNDFKKGKVEKFHLDLTGMGKLTDICIRRDDTGQGDSW